MTAPVVHCTWDNRDDSGPRRHRRCDRSEHVATAFADVYGAHGDAEPVRDASDRGKEADVFEVSGDDLSPAPPERGDCPVAAASPPGDHARARLPHTPAGRLCDQFRAGSGLALPALTINGQVTKPTRRDRRHQVSTASSAGRGSVKCSLRPLRPPPRAQQLPIRVRSVSDASAASHQSGSDIIQHLALLADRPSQLGEGFNRSLKHRLSILKIDA